MGRAGNCCVNQCPSRAKEVKSAFNLHAIPRDKARKQDWIQRIRFVNGADWEPKPHALICSMHFPPHCYELKRMDGLKKLRPDAAPVFRFPTFAEKHLGGAIHSATSVAQTPQAGIDSSSDVSFAEKHLKVEIHEETPPLPTLTPYQEITGTLVPILPKGVLPLQPPPPLAVPNLEKPETFVPVRPRVQPLPPQSSEFPNTEKTGTFVPIRPKRILPYPSESPHTGKKFVSIRPKPLQPKPSKIGGGSKIKTKKVEHDEAGNVIVAQPMGQTEGEWIARLTEENATLEKEVKRLAKIELEFEKLKAECERMTNLANRYYNENLSLKHRKMNDRTTWRRKYEALKVTTDKIEDSLQTILNPDQLECLTRLSSRGMKWSLATIEDALSIRKKLGDVGYNEIARRFPYPHTRTLQKFISRQKKKGGGGNVSEEDEDQGVPEEVASGTASGLWERLGGLNADQMEAVEIRNEACAIFSRKRFGANQQSSSAKKRMPDGPNSDSYGESKEVLHHEGTIGERNVDENTQEDAESDESDNASESEETEMGQPDLRTSEADTADPGLGGPVPTAN